MRPLPVIIKSASLPTPPARIVASLTAGQHVDHSGYSLYSAFSPLLPTIPTWGVGLRFYLTVNQRLHPQQ